MVLAINSEFSLPENAPVRLTSAQLEELDYEKLYRAYSARGRKSKVDPRVLFKVMVYGYQCGIYSSHKLEEAGLYRIDFKWLLEENPFPDHTTLARFRTGRCGEVRIYAYDRKNMSNIRSPTVAQWRETGNKTFSKKFCSLLIQQLYTAG